MKRLLIFFFLIFLNILSVSATTIYSDKLNIPMYQAHHTQNITLNSPGEIFVTIPSNMTLITFSGSPTITSTDINWTNESSVSYVLMNSANLREETTLKSQVYVNGVYQNQFLFVVVPDEKITNCKAELGHGEGNWLNTQYLPAGQDLSLFNLVRVFTLASYYNEDAVNASVTCVFPSYHILVSQGNLGTVIQHNNNNITATFAWDNLGKNWFRVAPLEQEIQADTTNVGDIYSVSCGDLEYYYSTGRVTTPTTCHSFEFRNPQPFNITYGDKLNQLSQPIGKIIAISNHENYSLYDVEFKFSVGSGDFETYNIKQLQSGEMVLFELVLDGTSTLMTQINYVPEWWANTVQNNPHETFYYDSTNYTVNANTPKIIEVVVSEFLQQGNKAEISNVIELYKGEIHKGVLHTTDFFGTPIAADFIPQVFIFKSDGTLVSTFPSVNTALGEYKWTFNTTSLSVGIYETMVSSIMNGQPVVKNSFWRLVSSGGSLNVTTPPLSGGNTGPGNGVTLTPSTNLITGDAVNPTVYLGRAQTCSLYGYNGSFLTMCWWEWWMVWLMALIIVKIIWYFKINIKNIFKTIW